MPEKATKESNLPIIVFFRGGAWVIADLDVYDATPFPLIPSPRRAGLPEPWPGGEPGAASVVKNTARSLLGAFSPSKKGD